MDTITTPVDSPVTGDTTNKRNMTPEHKAALAEGRRRGKVIRAYLEVVDSHPRKRISTIDFQARLDKVNAALLVEQDPVEKVKLSQDKINLETRLREQDTGMISDLEKQFIEVAKPWAEAHNVTYVAFRQVGVPPAVLKAAGLTRVS